MPAPIKPEISDADKFALSQLPVGWFKSDQTRLKPDEYERLLRRGYLEDKTEFVNGGMRCEYWYRKI